MANIKVAVIGCGYWGKNLVRNFAALDSLAAVCDSNGLLAATIAEQYGVHAMQFDELLNSDINALVIATPAAQHYYLAKQALAHGKHVLAEKPLALRVAEAKELCELSIKNKNVLMVGHLMHYHSGFLKLKHLVTSGELGKIQYIYSSRLNLGKFRNEENILWSFAPHDISMILGLMGDVPETVYAAGSCHLNIKIHDITTTNMVFRSGVQAHIFVSWLHPYKEQKLVVVGDRGMAVFDDGLDWSEKLKLYPNQISWINGMPEPKKATFINVALEPVEPLKLECQHFLTCVQNKQQPITDGYEGLKVLMVLDAAQQALYSKANVSINQQCTNYFKHETALIDDKVEIGDGTKIWHFSHILSGSKIGKQCIIGQNVMIGPEVKIGNNCKIQNNVSLYRGLILGDGVFCGPSSVFTNVMNPRAEIERKNEFKITQVEDGVTIGANATIVCGVRLGAFSFIGAGAVVTKDVKAHALVVGNPARQVGWVSHAGEKLDQSLVCKKEGRKYEINAQGDLQEIKEEVVWI